MIEKKKRWKTQRTIRRWASKNSKKVYEDLGKFCNKCKSADNLSIHHKEYKRGIEFLEVLCQKCHRSFHEKETKKRLLMYCLDEIKKFKGYSVKDLKEWLQEKINEIPVKIIPNIEFDGFEK